MLKKITKIDVFTSALTAWWRGSGPLRLLARARRHPNALLAAIIGLGVLLMVIHWSGSAQSQSAQRAAAHGVAGAEAPRRDPAAVRGEAAAAGRAETAAARAETAAARAETAAAVHGEAAHLAEGSVR
jgi:hypothetical protein